MLNLSGCRETNNGSNFTAKTFCQDQLVHHILEKVQAEYVEVPNEQRMREGALNGMLMALDPYSGYMNEESYQFFAAATTGEFGGVGLEVLPTEQGLRIISPMEDTPASLAGLQPGDMITHVDGQALLELPYGKVISMLQGKPGTKVILTVQRAHEKLAPLTLERAIIRINPVKFKILGNVAYLRITYFAENTTSALKDAIQQVKKNIGPNLQGVILDLRNNPGGLLEQAIGVTDLLIEGGVVVQIKSRNSEKKLKVKGQNLLKSVPMVVLINEGSASGSEVVAGALKDYKRAILVGKPSYGKGSVQAVFRLQGQGAIKVTISKFYTPLGKEIHERGIEPDIVVNDEPGFKMWVKDTVHKDIQLQQAIDILRGLNILSKNS